MAESNFGSTTSLALPTLRAKSVQQHHVGNDSAKFLYRSMSSSSNHLTRSNLVSSSGSRPSVHTFNGSGHLLTTADQSGPRALGSGNGQMPRFPVHQFGAHLEYPYQGSRAPTWASVITMSEEGTDFRRIPAPGTHAVPAFVTPNIFVPAFDSLNFNLHCTRFSVSRHPSAPSELPNVRYYRLLYASCIFKT